VETRVWGADGEGKIQHEDQGLQCKQGGADSTWRSGFGVQKRRGRLSKETKVWGTVRKGKFGG
jgi:hypothetical protein